MSGKNNVVERLKLEALKKLKAEMDDSPWLTYTCEEITPVVITAIDALEELDRVKICGSCGFGLPATDNCNEVECVRPSVSVRKKITDKCSGWTLREEY